MPPSFIYELSDTSFPLTCNDTRTWRKPDCSQYAPAIEAAMSLHLHAASVPIHGHGNTHVVYTSMSCKKAVSYNFGEGTCRHRVVQILPKEVLQLPIVVSHSVRSRFVARMRSWDLADRRSRNREPRWWSVMLVINSIEEGVRTLSLLL